MPEQKLIESALRWRRDWPDVKDEIEMETGCDCDACCLMRSCDEYMEQAEFKKEDYKHMIIYDVSNDSSSVLFKFKKDAEDYKSSHSGLSILERYVFCDSQLISGIEKEDDMPTQIERIRRHGKMIQNFQKYKGTKDEAVAAEMTELLRGYIKQAVDEYCEWKEN